LALVIVVIVLFLPQPVSSTTPASSTTEPYNCYTKEKWSVAKQQYCCATKKLGCPTTTQVTTTEPNCYTKEVWSQAKQDYCCRVKNLGCPTTVAPPKPPAVPKMCVLWGDPHIITFDQVGTDKNQATSFYGDGDFYIVKSSTVVIQGRFEGTKYTEGLAATNRIVVGGPFLHGHKIEVGTRESGVLTVDGEPVLTGFPSQYVGLGFTLKYNDQGEVPDVVPEGNEKRIVHMDLPLGVRVVVYQWENYMDVKIVMTKQPGHDGVCGNFNGNMGDDTTQAIMARIGARVPRSENLLSGRAVIEWTPQMEQMLKAECAASKRAAGHAACARSLGGVVGHEVDSCTFDYCFGMNVRARKHAKTYA